jgi:hypothetical protein
MTVARAREASFMSIDWPPRGEAIAAAITPRACEVVA